MKKLVLASGNAGKLREFGQLLAPFDFEVLPQSAFNVPEADEPHITFVENAIAKARHAAQLTAVLVLMRHADDPQPVITEGEWHGEIIDTPRGEGGFGYDPYFMVPGTGLTAAELPHEEKNRSSHRGKALAQLIERLRLGM